MRFIKNIFWWDVDKRIKERVRENLRSSIHHMNGTIVKLQNDCEALEHRHDLDIKRIDATTQRLNTYGYIFRDAVHDMEICIARYPIVKDYLRQIITSISDRRLSCESTAVKQIDFLLTYLTTKEREMLQLKLTRDAAMQRVIAAANDIDELEPCDDDEEDEFGNPLDPEGNEL